MKTTDLRPWAIALLASVYSVVFWMFQSRGSRDDSEPAAVWYDELPPSSRPEVPLPAGWTIAGAHDTAPEPRQTIAPRVRTRSS